jgi:phosphate:Na+ symporter
MTPDFVKIILNLIAGVAIFLYGMSVLSNTMQLIAGKKMEKILARLTKNTFIGILTGIWVTALMGSSSMVIILVIALVNGRFITFTQSLGIVMGSNIGTTLATQIIAFRLADYCALILLLGLIILFTTQNEKRKHIGTIFMGIGLIFFGLEFMDYAVSPLRNYEPFSQQMLKMENPYLGVFIGGLFTVIIQASSATVAIAIALASQNLITLPAGIALMMGAEIGTCSDTLLASLGRTREAVRTGLFHLFFNVFSVVLGIMFIHPFTDLVVWLSAGASIPRQIANAHFLFNVLGTVLFVSFVPWIVNFLYFVLPTKIKVAVNN